MPTPLVVSEVAKSFTMHLRDGIRLPVVSNVTFSVKSGECVVLGGSVTQSFDLFAPALTRTVQESCYFGREPEKWLKTAALNADCGLIGAGILAMERFTE